MTQQDTHFQQLLQTFVGKQAELKDIKKFIREAENDVPMELEDLLMSIKDLRKQAKELKDAHVNNLLENNVEYGENRERVQLLKEEIAQAKLELFTLAANLSREHGDLDKTVMVEGAPMRLQTQREVSVYVDGKMVKA